MGLVAAGGIRHPSVHVFLCTGGKVAVGDGRGGGK